MSHEPSEDPAVEALVALLDTYPDEPCAWACVDCLGECPRCVVARLMDPANREVVLAALGSLTPAHP